MINEQDIEFLKEIGNGAFGEVFEGSLKENEKLTKVAIKVSAF